MKLFHPRSILPLLLATPLAAACTGGPTTNDAAADANDVARDTPPPNDASPDAAEDASDAADDAATDVTATDASPGQLTVTSSGALVSTWTCGDEFPAGGDVTLRNDGGSPVTYHSGFSGPYATSFSATRATNGTLAPGATATIHVAPVRWMQDATPLVTRNAVFHVTVDEGFGGGDVPVEITPHGAIVVVDTFDSNFGDVRVGSNATLGFSTSNVGDRDATLTLGAFGDSQFASPAAPGTYTLAAHATRDDSARFAPTHGGTAIGMLASSVTGPICYSNVATRNFRGNAITGNIAVSGDIDFGLTLCGGTASPRTITMTNSGTAPAAFTATLGSSARYRLSATGGTVSPGAPYTLTVTPASIPNLVPALPGDFGDVVVISTDVPGDTPHVVNLTQGARGALLAWDRSSVNLAAAVGTTATASLTLSNSGSDPVTVQLVSSLGEVPVAPSEATVVPAHGSIAATVSYSATTATQAFRSAVFPQMPVTGLCQIAPPPVVVDARSSRGELLLDRDAVEFGNAECGSSASDRTVVLTNPTPSTVSVHARLAIPSSPFTLSIGSATPSDTVNTTIAAGESVSLVVHAPAIPAMPPGTGAMTDTLVVTSDAPSDTGHVLPIHLQPSGAIVRVEVPSSTLDLGSIPTGTSASRTIAFTNTGSAPVDVRLSVGTDFYWSRDLLTLPADGSPVYATLNGFARNAGDNTTNFDVAIVGSTPLCAPAPARHAARVTGINGTVWLSASAIDFGRNPCRQAPPPARIVLMSNEGTAPFMFTASTEGPFAVTPTSGSIAPGATIPLQVSARAIIDGTPGQLRGGALVVGTDIVGDAIHRVALRDQVYGAQLSYPTTGLDFGSVRVGSDAERRIGVRNTGNATATLTIASTGGASSRFSANTVLAPDTDMLATVYPTTAGRFAEDWTLSVPTALPLCAPFAPIPTHLAVTAVDAQLYPVPTSVNFGGVACNGPAPTSRTVELRNPTTVPVPFTTSLFWGADSRMAVAPSSGTIPAGGATTLTITSMPIPADLELAPATRPSFLHGGLEDSLNVSFGSGSIDVPLHEYAIGSVYHFERQHTELSVSSFATDSLDMSTTGACPGGHECWHRWTIQLSGPIAPFVLNDRWGILRFQEGTPAGAIATMTAVDEMPGLPICHGPPSPAATWTAIP